MKNIAERDTDARPTGRPGWRWIKAALLVFLAFALVALVFLIYHAEPILQARIIETLSARFQSPVQLAEFHVSIDHGFQVSGQGLKIFGKSDLNVHRLGIQPLIAVDEFRFNAGILNLLHAPMRVHRVYLKGLELNIPAREQRSEGISLKGRKIKIWVDEFLCEQSHLVINTLKPDKLPLEFHAIVDGTSGDTYLEPVKGKILHSSLVAEGSVLRMKDPHGHRIALNVIVPHANIEDLLEMMANDMSWTTDLGNAFLSQQQDL